MVYFNIKCTDELSKVSFLFVFVVPSFYVSCISKVWESEIPWGWPIEWFCAMC